jgi:hypothetical protein
MNWPWQKNSTRQLTRDKPRRAALDCRFAAFSGSPFMIEELETIDASAVSARLAELRRFL